MFDACPMRDLTIRNQSAEDLQKTLDLQGIKFIYEDEKRYESSLTWFPETQSHAAQRVHDQIDDCHSFLKQQKGGMAARIFVSHGFFIDNWHVMVSGKPQQRYCDYCAVTAVEFELNEGAEIS